MTGKKKRNIISFEIIDNLNKRLNEYIIFMGGTKSELIRSLLWEALIKRTEYKQFERLSEYLAGRDPFKFRTECEKCGEKDNLIIFYIDGNINNIKTDNVVTLCKNCLNEFELFRLKYNIKEKFIEWFFKD
jgi:hypothetical protein